jgi:hypothetical protein
MGQSGPKKATYIDDSLLSLGRVLEVLILAHEFLILALVVLVLLLAATNGLKALNNPVSTPRWAKMGQGDPQRAWKE